MHRAMVGIPNKASAFRPVSRGQVQTSLRSAACKMDVYDESLLQPIEPAKGTEEKKCCSTIFVLKVLYFLANFVVNF